MVFKRDRSCRRVRPGLNFSVYQLFANIVVLVMSTVKLKDVTDASMRESCLTFSGTGCKCTKISSWDRRKEILHCILLSWHWLTSFIEIWSAPSLGVLAGKSFNALIVWRRSKQALMSCHSPSGGFATDLQLFLLTLPQKAPGNPTTCWPKSSLKWEVDGESYSDQEVWVFKSYTVVTHLLQQADLNPYKYFYP